MHYLNGCNKQIQTTLQWHVTLSAWNTLIFHFQHGLDLIKHVWFYCGFCCVVKRVKEKAPEKRYQNGHISVLKKVHCSIVYKTFHVVKRSSLGCGWRWWGSRPAAQWWRGCWAAPRAAPQSAAGSSARCPCCSSPVCWGWPRCELRPRSSGTIQIDKLQGSIPAICMKINWLSQDHKCRSGCTYTYTCRHCCNLLSDRRGVW